MSTEKKETKARDHGGCPSHDMNSFKNDARIGVHTKCVRAKASMKQTIINFLSSFFIIRS